MLPGSCLSLFFFFSFFFKATGITALQDGLRRNTVIDKRGAFRDAFHEFDVQKVAQVSGTLFLRVAFAH
jgi:3-methyladenine DNA glycosylase Tag